MSWFDYIVPKAQPRYGYDINVGGATKNTKIEDDGLFKAYIPNFLYKPPYGMPRRVNTSQFKELAKNAYVFSVIKTLCDEAVTIDWEIKVKEEFNNKEEEKEQEGVEGEADTEDVEEKAEKKNYEDKINEITKFFRNPNGNDESFEHILRAVITDICEVDAGVIVKVFNRAGELKQIIARDGATFLKNPDIYGYMGDRQDFVAPLPDGFTGIALNYGGTPAQTQQQMMRQYDILYRQNAAYFQYGWTAGSMPVPFGKREIIYIMQNPRGDSVYGRSPIEILETIILNLVYGSELNLDFFTNNNMPDGAIQLLGAQQEHIKQFRENWENNFKYTDGLGNKRKRFFSVPIATTEVKFTPFQLTSKDMEVLEQQSWFGKILWMCFGVTADEMGFVEDSNRAVATEQAKIFKRKAIRPLLDLIAYHINTQLMPEFFAKISAGNSEVPDFADVPLEFCFDTYDIDEDLKKHELWQQQLNMGIKTKEMVAEEAGINIAELKKSTEEQEEKEFEKFQKMSGDTNEIPNGAPDKQNSPFPQKKKEGAQNNNRDKGKGASEKSSAMIPTPFKTEKVDNPMKEVEDYIDGIGEALVQAIEKVDESELGK